MEAQLTELAMHDPLTGLLNRRSLIQEMNREYGRVLRCENYPVGLLMLDIDHFKRVNDTYGHAVGDEVLKVFARRILEQLRENDIVGRLGGEEFAILLPNTSHEGAIRVGEKVRQAVAQLEVVREETCVKITTSVGVAQLDPADSRPDGALIQADQALYQAKKDGRNRVVGACNRAAACDPIEIRESNKAG